MLEVFKLNELTGLNDTRAIIGDKNRLVSMLFDFPKDVKISETDRKVIIQTSDNSARIELYRADVLPQIEGIDTTAGAKRFMKKNDRYLAALLKFCRELQKQEELTDDREKLRTEIHKIKGIAANLDVYKVYESAKRFEKAIIDEKDDILMLNEYKDICKTAKDAILGAFK